MNKSFLKFVTDFGPLAIFFFYYYNSGKNLSVAIPPLIVATLVALAIVWFFEKKIPPMPLVSGILITFFGGLTIYFNDPIFIYVKPTIINIMFGLALLNEIVWRTQTEEFWVNFKVWGMLPITIIFTGFQIPLINKHKLDA